LQTCRFQQETTYRENNYTPEQRATGTINFGTKRNDRKQHPPADAPGPEGEVLGIEKELSHLRKFLSGLIVVAAIAMAPVQAATSAGSDLERRFAQTIRPFLGTYCVGCHGGSAPAARFDLSVYSTAAAVIRNDDQWGRVLDRLMSGQMPPRPVKQPTEEDRQKVVEWIQAVRMSEARKNAGDPGPVLARRLSNAEYDYTIRDLTGVDIRPAREFPVDPANTAGFDNSGESLGMSSTLLNKYLQAAHEVASHVVLTQDSFTFSPHPMLAETDREKFAIRRIVDFYQRQPTDLADYFRAAWLFRYRAVFGKARATLADIATETKVSPKYLAMVWDALEESKEEIGPLARLQTMWRALPVPKSGQPSLAREGCAAMRDYVARIRRLTSEIFHSPVVAGLSATSQPLMNWKLRNFATHRRDFDRLALRVEGEPPPPESALVLDRAASAGITPPDEERIKNYVGSLLDGRRHDPDLAVPAGQRKRYEAALTRFSQLFPNAFYIAERSRFYPVDTLELDKGRLLSAGFHNVTGYFRDDLPLMELILDEEGKRTLERLWADFEFIADFTRRTWIEYFFDQSGEVQGRGRESGSTRPSDQEISSESLILSLRAAYLAKVAADPKSDPAAKTAIEDHFQRVNGTIRSMERLHEAAEPLHLERLLKFADRAYRRPLAQTQRERIVAFYRALRKENSLTHEEAIRNSIAGILMSPEFSYRIDLVDGLKGARGRTVAARPAAGAPTRAPISAYALASKLSYFLWSSMPDEELLSRAAAGDLQKPDILIAQARRMWKDSRARGLAVEFAGNWLDFRRFEEHNAVDRERFPSFNNELREAMFEEPVRFIENLIRNDGSVMDLLYGGYTFVNPVLARHYGMPEVAGNADTWIRVEGANRYGRGGLLGMSVFLTQNSPGLRTSPVKRGYWVAKRLLGETIPPPPASVPELPSDEAKMDLPLRDMLARHRENPACAACHSRFDSFGLALEGYGPVGEKRTHDLAGRPVDTQAVFPGGITGVGFEGLRAYIREQREKQFLANLCRKLLAYAIGRSLQLSDEPTIAVLQTRLAANGYRLASLVEVIVSSPQFRTKRAADAPEQKGE
jgi:mono/diheme cytochrome c family protein